MAGIGYIASTVVMGVVLTVVAVALGRAGTRRPAPIQGVESMPPGGTGVDRWSRYSSAVGRLTRSSTTWYVTFLLVGIGLAAGGLAFVTAPSSIGPTVGIALAVAFAGLLCVFLAWGVYHTGRYRGLETAHAVAVGVWVLGGLVIVAVAVKLVLSGS